MAQGVVRSIDAFLRVAARVLAQGVPEAGEAAALGDRARDSGSWSEALPHYRRTVKLDPNLWAIWVQLGHACKETGDPQAAEEAYRQALKLRPDVADTYLQLGHALKVSGLLKEAYDAYRDALRLDPSSADARAEMAAVSEHIAAMQNAQPSRHVTQGPGPEAARRPAANSLVVDLTAFAGNSADVARRLMARFSGLARATHPVNFVRWNAARSAFVQVNITAPSPTPLPETSDAQPMAAGDGLSAAMPVDAVAAEPVLMSAQVEAKTLPSTAFARSIVLAFAPVRDMSVNHELRLLELGRGGCVSVVFAVADFDALVAPDPGSAVVRCRFAGLRDSIGAAVCVENDASVEPLLSLLDLDPAHVAVMPTLTSTAETVTSGIPRNELEGIWVVWREDDPRCEEVKRTLQAVAHREAIDHIHLKEASARIALSGGAPRHALVLAGGIDAVALAGALAARGTIIAGTDDPGFLPASHLARIIFTGADFAAKDFAARFQAWCGDDRAAVTPVVPSLSWDAFGALAAAHVVTEGHALCEIRLMSLEDRLGGLKGLRTPGMDVSAPEAAWRADGLALGEAPTCIRFMDPRTGGVKQEAFFLVAAHGPARVTIQSGRDDAATADLGCGDAIWVSMRATPDKNGGVEFAVTTTGADGPDEAILLAAVIIECGQEFLWARIQDDIACGKVPYLREAMLRTRWNGQIRKGRALFGAALPRLRTY